MKTITDKYTKISHLKDWSQKKTTTYKCPYQSLSADERGVSYLKEIIHMAMICCIDNR